MDGLTHPYCMTPYGINGIISVIAYKGIVKKLLYQFKYKPYLADLKTILSRLFYEGLIQQEAFMKFINNENVIITSVPLHPSRLKKRGYNQSDLLAKEIARLLNLKYMSSILDRKINTKPQFNLSKKERRGNMRGAFQINSKIKIQKSKLNIILVDDITTTGATLRECAKVLKAHGAKRVLGVTLAHEG